MKQEPKHLANDMEHISSVLAKRHINLSSQSLKKLLDLFTGKRKLSPEALNRLALFAGFQSWSDLSDALHGETDASVNYEEREEDGQK